LPGLRPEDLARLVLVSSPSASPDGSRALFVVTRPNLQQNRYDSSIWLHDGKGYYPLTSGPGDACPSWSPDGSLISFIRTVRQEGQPPQFSLMVLRLTDIVHKDRQAGGTAASVLPDGPEARP